MFGSRFYVNPDKDESKNILVAGTARSGTTWLGDLIAAQIPSRILFEPFNPVLVPEYRNFHYFQYMRPGVADPDFQAFAQRVFTGEIRGRWIDRYNERIFSRVRLIKEIRANLALKWLHDHFSSVPILFLVRHPCAVVLSRMELSWATDTDIDSFLTQPDLMEDHLDPYVDLIHNARSIEEKHAIIWSISNLVPLKQSNPGELNIIFYENLCTQPEIEMPAIFQTLGFEHMDPVTSSVNRPSQTTKGTSAVVTGTDKIKNWGNKLSHSQVENILRIVDAFGLSHLYGDSFSPLQTSLISVSR